MTTKRKKERRANLSTSSICADLRWKSFHVTLRNDSIFSQFRYTLLSVIRPFVSPFFPRVHLLQVEKRTQNNRSDSKINLPYVF